MKRVLIAGGGTGGHIYPAIAIAQVLKRRNADSEVHFIGAKSGLETKIVPREGYPLHLLNVGALNQVSLFTKITSLLLLPWALLQAIVVILKVRPNVVLGVGGYASGPAMLAAKILRKPTYLFEPNAHPGLTNRWLSKSVKKAFLNFEASRKYFGASEIVGIPVREGLKPSRSSSAKKSTKFNILVFGGSQGARGINLAVIEAVKRGGTWLNDVNLVHQIGRTDFTKMKNQYEEIFNDKEVKSVEWIEFLYDMPERYEKADLVVCRAGASTLAELAATRKASVLIPLPTAADDHQRSNAEALSSQGACLLVLQKEFTSEKFIEVITDYKEHREKIELLEENVAKFYKPRSSEKIAIELEKYF
jgi:UDP-N-acetylglucosamine--N-acetylmuramyl-(pentapeptide) pyrophosphoryl-undecaprenol N-acetylglucosamine transferase